jgi:hypothetical protein
MALSTERKAKKGFNFLNSITIEQRNTFLQETLAYETGRLHNMIAASKKDPENYRAQTNATYAQNILDNKMGIKTLSWLNDANEYFNAKINQCVIKLDGFGMLEENIMLDRHIIEDNHNRGLDFTISGWNMTTQETTGRVKARLIPVDGYEKCFHYRFLCTLKGAPKKVNKVVIEETTVEVDTKQTKKEQIMILFNAGKSTKDISMLTGSNISYVRNIIRTNK